MITTLFYSLGFLVMLVLYFYVTSMAVAIGVKNGFMLFLTDYLPIFTEQLNQQIEINNDISATQHDVENGTLSNEEATKILKNILGK